MPNYLFIVVNLPLNYNLNIVNKNRNQFSAWGEAKQYRDVDREIGVTH